MDVQKLRNVELQPVVDAVGDRIPTWKGQLMNTAGRLVLTKVTLSAISTHISIAFALAPWAIKAINRKRRAFFWKGTDAVRGGQ